MAHPDRYRIDALLSDEERMTRDMVRAFVAEKYIPVVTECFKKGEFPRRLVKEMANLGFFGIKASPEYGGLGMNNVCYGLLCQELEYGDSGLRSFVSVQNSLVIYPIEKFGSEEQKMFWLPKLISGEAIGAFGLTEPNIGSDPCRMKARAKKEGNGYILNGSKQWITNGSIADVLVVWAKTDDGTVRGFLVEKRDKGFSSEDIKNKLSLNASVTSTLFFDDVKLDESRLLPESGGLKSALSCLNEARYGIAWGVIGVASACFDAAARYTSERKQYGKILNGFQITQVKLADVLTKITAMQTLAYILGKNKNNGTADYVMVSIAKKHNVATAREIASITRPMLGANGISLEYRVMRHMVNLESVYTYEGTDDIHSLIIGRDITGKSALE